MLLAWVECLPWFLFSFFIFFLRSFYLFRYGLLLLGTRRFLRLTATLEPKPSTVAVLGNPVKYVDWVAGGLVAVHSWNGALWAKAREDMHVVGIRASQLWRVRHLGVGREPAVVQALDVVLAGSRWQKRKQVWHGFQRSHCSVADRAKKGKGGTERFVDCRGYWQEVSWEKVGRIGHTNTQAYPLTLATTHLHSYIPAWDIS